MENGNYIKVNRKILEWEWYSDINTTRLFIHMLLKANWKEGKFHGTTVPRGSFISSCMKLSEETRLTIREIRTGISHLKSTGELTCKSTNKYTVFTVVNYEMYQTNDIQSYSQETNDRQSNDIQTTTIEERKKERKEEGKKEDITVSKDTVCRTDVQRAIEEWNLLEQYGIKKISRITSGTQRYERLNARIKQYGIDDVLCAIGRVSQSSFLQGKSNNTRQWVITFDWFVCPNNFPKVLDGNYDDNFNPQTTANGGMRQILENVGMKYKENYDEI